MNTGEQMGFNMLVNIARIMYPNSLPFFLRICIKLHKEAVLTPVICNRIKK
jgi:hypothetical protein